MQVSGARSGSSSITKSPILVVTLTSCDASTARATGWASRATEAAATSSRARVNRPKRANRAVVRFRGWVCINPPSWCRSRAGPRILMLAWG